MKEIFKKIWQIWKSFTRVWGRFNAYLILTLFYFLIIGPVSLLRKIIKNFSSKTGKDSYWSPKKESGGGFDYKHQF